MTSPPARSCDLTGALRIDTDEEPENERYPAHLMSEMSLPDGRTVWASLALIGKEDGEWLLRRIADLEANLRSYLMWWDLDDGKKAPPADVITKTVNLLGISRSQREIESAAEVSRAEAAEARLAEAERWLMAWQTADSVGGPYPFAETTAFLAARKEGK